MEHHPQYHKVKVVINFPTVKDLNGGLDYSTRTQDPVKEKVTLTPAESRIRAYRMIQQIESGGLRGEAQWTTRGDNERAYGSMQMWSSYYIDAEGNPGRRKHKRPWHLKGHGDLELGLDAGAEAFAEYQRRYNEEGWKAGDVESMALLHHLGPGQFKDYQKGRASNKVNQWVGTYKKKLTTLPKHFYNLENYKLKPQGAEPLTKLSDSDEKHFNQWYSEIARVTKLAPNPNDPEHYYDYRKFWKEAKTSGTPLQVKLPMPEWNTELQKWKWPSKYKRVGHPNFYVMEGDQLINTKTGKPVLDWFSYQTLKTVAPKELEKYDLRIRDNNNLWRWKPN